MTARSIGAQAARLVDAWFDRERGGRAVAILLLLFVVAWTLFHMVSNASLAIHPDLGEIYVWSRHLQPGYYKHPPLGALMGAAWFAVFPATDWSFYLLAMTNAALALFFVYLIARRYLAGDKRLFALLLLLLTPFYQFLSERFASNQTLLATWPLATYCFLRAYETRGFAWSAAAGAAAALAMLGKYYSIYLVGGLVVAALAHPARWDYLKSPSPWISIAAGLVVLSPHLYWLVTTGFQPFGYAVNVHGATQDVIARKSFRYLTGAVAYVLLPIATYLVVVRPDRATLRAALWPDDPDRRMLVVLLAAFLLLPPLSAPFLRVSVTSLWTMQAWFLLPIILLSPASAIVPRPRARLVAFGVAVFTAGALAVAPAVAWYYHATGGRLDRAYFRVIADELDTRWRGATDRPFGIAFGDWDISSAMAFYLPGHPDSAPIAWLWAFPWITEDRIAREGWLVGCPVVEPVCMGEAKRRIAADPRARAAEVELTPRFLGRPGRPRRFLLAVAPPPRRDAAGPAEHKR